MSLTFNEHVQASGHTVKSHFEVAGPDMKENLKFQLPFRTAHQFTFHDLITHAKVEYIKRN